MPKIALVHDYLVQMGGAEQVVEALHEMFPDSPIYTTVAAREKLLHGLRGAEIHTTWMQRLPALERLFRHYFMLYPWAVESMDLSPYDIIVSSTSGYAKGVRRRAGAVHVCYCHTPMRWVWRYGDYAAREEFSPLARAVLPGALGWLRRWDLRAAEQPDYYIANSRVVARRIKQVYGREAAVIPPPINIRRFHLSSEQDDYYLVLSRLVAYKRIDLAVEACTRLGRPLVVIGDGPDRARLERMAGPTVKFLGRQPDAEVARYAARCRALLFPGEEDFGLTPLEINAAGRPVIAYRAGGALDTVVPGVTGLFFERQTSHGLIAALEEFEGYGWDPQALRRHAEGYDRQHFAARFRAFLDQVTSGARVEEKKYGAA
jgi:glycosyltransferase involved in cell wall biosynthesis